MNAIPYFDYSLAPFWPSYQNKVIGVLERALREQSGSRIRRILLRLPWEHDNAFSSRKIWFGMDFIETVSALMNAKPGRDLCWLLTRHPEKPEYHVVLCVRQEYFDGPELDRLILLNAPVILETKLTEKEVNMMTKNTRFSPEVRQR
ncbi:hypothetical protein ACTMMW_02415, partial [Escherichia coli]